MRSSILFNKEKLWENLRNATPTIEGKERRKRYRQRNTEFKEEILFLHAISVSQFSHPVHVKNSFERKFMFRWTGSTFSSFSLTIEIASLSVSFSFFSPSILTCMNSFHSPNHLKCHHYKKYIITASNIFSCIHISSSRIKWGERQMSC